MSLSGDPRLWILTLIVLGIKGILTEDFSMFIVFASCFFQSYLIYFIIKQYFRRPRPFISLENKGIKRLDKTGHGYSFPSGHSHHSALLIGLFILWFGPYPNLALGFIFPALLIYNLAVPYSRLISGCHYPSDVIFAIVEAYCELLLHWFITANIYLTTLEPIFVFFINL